jgi:hypothetical protein
MASVDYKPSPMTDRFGGDRQRSLGPVSLSPQRKSCQSHVALYSELGFSGYHKHPGFDHVFYPH